MNNFEKIKAMDIDFYTAVFEDVDEVRKVCEEYEGKKFSDEEWKERSTRVLNAELPGKEKSLIKKLK